MGSIAFITSSLLISFSLSRIFLTLSTSFVSRLRFTNSAVEKSSRKFLVIASVISSPARGTIPYAMIVPSFDIAISLVPAPTSTNAMLSILRSSGTVMFTAAIGSSVR